MSNHIKKDEKQQLLYLEMETGREKCASVQSVGPPLSARLFNRSVWSHRPAGHGAAPQNIKQKQNKKAFPLLQMR